jgi:hypothetical protein
MSDLLTTKNGGPPSGSPPGAPGDEARDPGGRLTRRALLGAGLTGAAALAAAGYGVDRLLAPGPPPHARLPHNGTPQVFHSRPDLLPTVTHYYGTERQAPGLLCVGPGSSQRVTSGPMIVDARGELVWFKPLPAHHWLTNLQVRSWRGKPVLTWWEGHLAGGYGVGEGVIADTSYREIMRVRAARGRTVDLHEFQLTPQGTALFTCTPPTVVRNLSSAGGPSSGQVIESVFQEVDVASGRLIREWKGLDHVEVAETYRTTFAPLDYLHVNSLDVLPDGDLLMSARNTWCLYKLDRRTGAVIWRLGGKRSDFAMGAHSQFAWQHDARRHPDGRITLFDDGFDGVTRSHKVSRGLILSVDEQARRVALAHADVSPSSLLSSGMGNAQLLPNSNLLIGFGDDPYTTEFSPAGDVVANLRMPQGQHSYRAFRLPWTGRPSDRPAVAARRDRSSGHATLYVSWNGATEVASWRLQGGARRSDLATVGRPVLRTGFETALPVGTGFGYGRAVALDAQGRELGASAVVAV